MSQYTGLRYGTQVLVTSGFYEGQIVKVVSWRDWNGNRHYSVRFGDGMCRWVSCDILSDQLQEQYYMGKDTYHRLMSLDKGKTQPDVRATKEIEHLLVQLDQLRFEKRKLFEQLETRNTYALSAEPKYIAALERVYDYAALVLAHMPNNQDRAGLIDTLTTVRKYRP